VDETPVGSHPAKTGHANQGTLQALRYVATAILADCLVLQKAGREDLRLLPACSGLRQRIGSDPELQELWATDVPME